METAIFLLHGFGGTPNELECLETKLTEKGYYCYSPTINGHGKDKKTLRKTNGSDWISGIKKEFQSLQNYDEIIIIGFSMGGLISTYLLDDKRIKKLILINTPIWVLNFKVILKDFFIPRKDWLNGVLRYKKSVFKVSIKSCYNLLSLMRRTRKNFGEVKIPTLILQCDNDQTARPKSAKFINKAILNSEVRMIKGGRHQFFQDTTQIQEEIASLIIDFIKS